MLQQMQKDININDIPIDYSSTNDPTTRIQQTENMSNTYLMKIKRHTL